MNDLLTVICALVCGFSVICFWGSLEWIFHYVFLFHESFWVFVVCLIFISYYGFDCLVACLPEFQPFEMVYTSSFNLKDAI